MLTLRIRQGRVEPIEFFKFVCVGYIVGAGVIFIPFSALFAATALFAPTLDDASKLPALVMPLAAIPVLVLQGAMFGGLVTLGLWLVSLRKPFGARDE